MKRGYVRAWAVATVLLLLTAPDLDATPRRPGLQHRTGQNCLAERIAPPAGYERIPAPGWSFASWLRGLPLREPGAVVRLFDGREKRYQDGAYAVVDMDVGANDLQQCADAVIRLRAEYLWAAGCAGQIAFDFTSGHRARWSDWSAGRRPVVSGSDVSWVLQSDPDSSYGSFRDYLDRVFAYAGSSSLARELEVVADPSQVLPGDIFIQGGFPGHAVLAADVAQNAQGERMFLLVQSYMPAQDVHVLRNPIGPDSPWYSARQEGRLETPEWTFWHSDLRRFPEPDCHGRADAVVPPDSTTQHVRGVAPLR